MTWARHHWRALTFSVPFVIPPNAGIHPPPLSGVFAYPGTMPAHEGGDPRADV